MNRTKKHFSAIAQNPIFAKSVLYTSCIIIYLGLLNDNLYLTNLQLKRKPSRINFRLPPVRRFFWNFNTWKGDLVTSSIRTLTCFKFSWYSLEKQGFKQNLFHYKNNNFVDCPPLCTKGWTHQGGSCIFSILSCDRQTASVLSVLLMGTKKTGGNLSNRIRFFFLFGRPHTTHHQASVNSWIDYSVLKV
jgi:hypothetical protein